MKNIFGIAALLLLSSSWAQAGTILQVKGASAIVEMTDAEIQSVKPEAGQQILLLFGAKQAPATIKKVSNKKVLITTTVNLAGQKAVAVRAAGAKGNSSSAQSADSRSNNGSRRSRNQKDWIIGGNLKYVTGSANIKITGFPGLSVKYSGFDASGVGMYYFGDVGVGLEGEYGTLSGADTSASHKLTQVQFSILGEYKIKAFSVGALFTLFSNIKDTDSNGNDNSLNGTGYGVYATYTVMPQVRIILDYKMASYKLDPASYSTSDIRLGAGYYF